MKKISLITALLTVHLLAACATIEGVGRDISGGANRVADWMN